MKPLTVPGTLDSLPVIGDYVKAAASEAGLDKRTTYRLRLAVDEIATNIIVHGYQERNLDGSVEVQATLEPAALTIALEDTAAAYDPMNQPEPDNLEAPLEERPMGGLGVFLARENVDEFRYEYVDGRNRNIFVIRRTSEGAFADG